MASKVLISTTMTWAAPARLAGAFAACGAIIEALAPRRHPVGASQALSRLHSYRPLQALSGLREVLEESLPDLIVPCDDRAVRHLVALAKKDARFTELVACSIGRLDGYETLLSRSGFLKEAERLGIEIPATMEVATEADLKAVLHTIGLPAVLKADGSWGGEGVSFAHNFDEAVAAFRHLALAPSRLRSLARAAKRQDANFLLQAIEPQNYAISMQRFIGGAPATCAFACWKGEVLASLHMDVVSAQEPAGPARILHRTTSKQMEDAARKIAKAFNLSGFHGLDFMRDESGALYLIEINPRATQICHLALGTGHDLPASLLAALENRAVSPRTAVTDAQTIALFPQSLPVGPHFIGAYHDIPAEDPRLLHALSAHKDIQNLQIALPNT